MRNTAIATIFIIGFMSSFTLSVQAKFKDTITQYFPIEKCGRFDLISTNGSLFLHGCDEKQIKVEATISYNTQAERDSISIDMRVGDNGVYVEERNTKDDSLSYIDVSYNVYVPRSTSFISIKSTNGNAYISRVHSTINVKLTNGQLYTQDLTGKINISAVNDKVEMGFSKLDSSSCSVSVASINGDVYIYLPKKNNASLHAHTGTGNIENHFNLENTMPESGGVTLDSSVGSGKADVTLESINGDIKILEYLKKA